VDCHDLEELAHLVFVAQASARRINFLRSVGVRFREGGCTGADSKAVQPFALADDR
jgi:hypothetical protein